MMISLLSSLRIALTHFKGPTYRALIYGETEGLALHLNLYLPPLLWKPCPLVVVLHGGGWSEGSYTNAGLEWLVGYGFAVASVQYRLSGQAPFPAQIHDVKSAIRWLKAHAEAYGYQAEQVGVAGISAGGHLAMLAGLARDETLERQAGGALEEDSEVDAVVNFFGASDLVLRARNQPHQTEPAHSVVHRLLGQAASENEAFTKLASPVFHISAESPPLFVIHGGRDPQVHVEQAHRITEAYHAAGRPVTLEVLPEEGHGGSAFFKKEFRDRVGGFFQEHLRPSVLGE